MQALHSVHAMQQSQDVGGGGPELLTALEVQELLHVDRSTVYRMAEDGRLPALRVGRSWRFPADRIRALRTLPDTPAAAVTAAPGPPAAPAPAVPADTATDRTDPGAPDPAVARAAVEIAADLLGVMMVVTDMHGRPLTEVANPSPWFRSHAGEPGVLDACITEWRDLADHPDLTPAFQVGALGFQCARAFIRNGSSLVGMVLAGGVGPAGGSPELTGLHHLDDPQRQRVLAALPRIAAAISTTAPRPAATAPKEDR